MDADEVDVVGLTTAAGTKPSRGEAENRAAGAVFGLVSNEHAELLERRDHSQPVTSVGAIGENPRGPNIVHLESAGGQRRAQLHLDCFAVDWFRHPLTVTL